MINAPAARTVEVRHMRVWLLRRWSLAYLHIGAPVTQSESMLEANLETGKISKLNLR